MARSDYDEAIHRPSIETLKAYAADANMSFNEDEVEDYALMVDELLGGLEPLIELREPRFGPQEIEYTDREPARVPEDNPNNVWIARGRIEGADDGLLEGKEVAFKDCIAVAGYPLTNGSAVLKGYTPNIDATIVTRVLDAGATVTGKLNQEAFAYSDSGDINDYGTVTNAHHDDYLGGGSSSGSGVAPAIGEVDIAFGGDQGGSIRIPASWNGIVGLKPTHGLVPFTGIFPVDFSMDHTGPMAATVEDTALALEAVAGVDVQDGIKLDPRQPRNVEIDEYTDALDEDVDGLSVATLEEGFGWEHSNPEVDAAVRDGVGVLEDLGAEVSEVSIDLHEHGVVIWTASMVQSTMRLADECGVGTNHKGWYWTDFIQAFSKCKESQAHDFPPNYKHLWLAARHLNDEYSLQLNAKARNLALEYERQVNQRLETYDALVMPTVPILPYEKDDFSTSDRAESRSGRVAAHSRIATIDNTCMFDSTGHPALTIPCGKAGSGLPVGMMLVGDHFDDRTLFQIASSFESETDWKAR